MGSIVAGNNPYFIQTDVAGRFLYSSNYGGPSIGAYRVNQSTGILTSAGADTAGVSGPVGLASDASGRFLYTVNNSAPFNVNMFSIDQSTGGITPLSTPTIAASTNARFVAVDPSNRFAFVTNTAVGTLGQYIVNPSTGILSANGFFSMGGTTANGVVVAPSGRFVYVAHQTPANYVSILTLNQSNGTVTSPLGNVSSLGADPYELVMHPSGRFMYSLDQSAATITQYNVNQDTGMITTVRTAAMVTNSVDFKIDPSGRFLYVCEPPTTIRLFLVDLETGYLTPSSTVTTPSTLNSVVALGKSTF